MPSPSRGAIRIPNGFIIGTTSADGCNVDCFVLKGQPVRTGQVLECEPVGLMEQIEDGQEDHNVLARIEGEEAALTAAVRDKLAEFVFHVFDHNDGKQIQVGRFLGPREAMEHVSAHLDSA